MVKIGIIGMGFVGDALRNGAAPNKDIHIVPYDPYTIPESKIEDLKDTELAFICVPTPMSKDGSICDSIIRNVLDQLSDISYNGIAIIKSTLLPTSVKQCIIDYPNLRIATNPEFLTERTAQEDFINAQWVIIGSDDQEAMFKIHGFYKHMVYTTHRPRYALVSAEAAMMMKYMCNVWFSVKVALMNEFYEMWDKLDCKGSWDTVTGAFALDTRVGPTHLEVPGPDGDFGFGGKCFPKDLNAFIKLAEKTGSSFRVMAAAWEDNKQYRNDKNWLTIDGAVTDDYEG